VSVTRRRGQTDIRGLVTAGRAVRQERFCWSRRTSVGFGVRIPLLLIVVTQVAPRAAASWSSWSGCFGVGWTKLLMPRAAWARGGLFLDPGESCRCVEGVNVEHAQRSEHERR